jgi:hypothetical protein
MSPSPTLEGFRLTLRQPSLPLAEIIWRWCFGIAAGVLSGALILEYLDTLTVNRADLLMLRSRHPVLIGRALAHVFAGSGPRLVSAMLLLIPALALTWMVAASLGRAATLRAMLGVFGSSPEKLGLRSLLGLNFLRTGAVLAAFLGFLGCAIIAGFVSTDAQPQPGLVFLLFLALALVVVSAWSMVNWFLSLASIFVVRDGRDTFSALADSISLCRDRPGPVMAAGSWFGLIHLILFGAATVAAGFPIALATAIPKAMTWFAILAITLLYFAAADYLYTARLAAYVRIVEDGHQPPAVVPPTPPVPVPSDPAPAYDRDDLILSDLETARGTV